MSDFERGLNLTIHRHVPWGDTSASGISSRTDMVTLVAQIDTRHRAARTYPLTGDSRGPFEVTDERPAVALVIRAVMGKLLYHVEPFHPEGYVFGRYMAGGTFVTGDSRFSDLVNFYGAVAFHDRNENR